MVRSPASGGGYSTFQLPDFPPCFSITRMSYITMPRSLVSFLPFEGMASLYMISALFGFLQGGIVPSCVIVVREHFSAEQMGARVGIVMLGVQAGLALGGWLSAQLVDLTGSPQAAFVSGVGWNLVSIGLIAMLLMRLRALIVRVA